MLESSVGGALARRRCLHDANYCESLNDVRSGVRVDVTPAVGQDSAMDNAGSIQPVAKAFPRPESSQTLREQYESVRRTYVAFAEAMRILVAQLCKNADLSVDSITARAKETSSVVDKVEKRSYTGLDQMIDKCGVRVITRYSSEITAVCKLLEREFDVLEVVEHGGETPASFGYASKHLVLRLSDNRSSLLEWRNFTGLVAEVQVRSILQHAWASISHSLDYKSGREVPAPVRRRLFRVAALLETGDEIFDTYRSEVAELRAEYRAQAEGGHWKDLPLNLDTLRVSWSVFPWERIGSVAEGAGWKKIPIPAEVNERLIPQLASVLVGAASHAGFSTVGQLYEFSVEAPRHQEVLAEMARLYEDLSGGMQLLAAPALVLAALLGNRYPLAGEGLATSPAFREAVVNARAKADPDG